MRWIVRQFQELTASELHDLLRLRVDVFVVEQQCAYPELDGRDRQSTHLLGYADGELVAYARWYEREGQQVLGRIVLRRDARGRGLGTELMQRALHDIGDQAIRISAQQPLEDYYRSLGFSTVSEPYDDFGIPHVDMVRGLRA